MNSIDKMQSIVGIGDDERIARIREFIDTRKHLKAISDDWATVVLKALDLFDSPHNLDQLWVWSRFVWLFGVRDTWEANAEVTELLKQTTHLEGLRASYVTLRKEFSQLRVWEFSKRARLVKSEMLLTQALERTTQQLLSQLATYADRDRRWNDRDEFKAYVSKVNG